MIHWEEFHSQVLGTKTHFALAWPDSAQLPLPGVLLFRGEPAEWLNPWQDETRGGRTALGVLEDLLAKGYCEPLLLIFPRTANGSLSEFLPWGNAAHPELLQDASFLGNGQFDHFLDRELLPRCVELGALQKNRLAVDGFSLGGAAAVYQAMRRPTLFRSCASFDGSFLVLEHDHPGFYPDTPSDLRLDRFAHWFGWPTREDIFRQQNPLDLALAGKAADLPPCLIHWSHSPSPASNGWRVQRWLEASGIENHAETPALHPHSDHHWWWVDEHLYRSLPFHARLLHGGSIGQL